MLVHVLCGLVHVACVLRFCRRSLAWRSKRSPSYKRPRVRMLLRFRISVAHVAPVVRVFAVMDNLLASASLPNLFAMTMDASGVT